MDGCCHHRRRAGDETVHRSPACPVARDHRVGSATDWDAAAAAATATDVAEPDGAAGPGASADQTVDREDAAAVADGETRHCVGRTRGAQHSSDPNNPRC